MTAPTTDAERVARLAAELGELGQRLAWVRYELLGLPIGGVSAATPPPAPPRPTGSEPPVPVAPEQPTGSDGLFSSRVLAWVGGSMTLIGVVMFLVLAASRGWFGVPARLVAGAVLGLALVGIGRRLRGRAGGEVGALALVGTGIAALYLDVATATAKFHHLPDLVGLGCGLVVAGAGLLLADRWRSAQLAAGVLIGAGFFMPAVTSGSLPLLVALVLVPQAAAAPVARRRGWPSTAVIGAAFPLVYGSVAAWDRWRLFSGVDAPASGPGVAAVVGVFVVGVLAALLTARRLSDRVVAWLVVSAPLPALQLAGIDGGWRGVLLAGLVGLALLAVALAPLSIPGTVRTVRAAAGAAGAVAIFEATVLWFDGAALTGVLLGQALVLAIVSHLVRRRAPLFGSAAYGVVGLCGAAFQDAPLWALTRFPAEPYLRDGQPDHPALVTGLSLSLLVLLVAGVFVLAGARLGWVRSSTAWLWVPAGVVTLYGAAGVVVTTGLLIAPVQAGFVTAHAVVTISWTLVALVLLARGLSRPALRMTGLILVAAAVAKLLLFDLVALDGLARVAAFVGAGLVLLTAGARYARLLAAQQGDQLDGLAGQRADERQPGQPDQPGDHGDGVLDEQPGPGQGG